eukprot:6322659-Prymnesium_polylepis.1
MEREGVLVLARRVATERQDLGVPQVPVLARLDDRAVEVRICLAQQVGAAHDAHALVVREHGVGHKERGPAGRGVYERAVGRAEKRVLVHADLVTRKTEQPVSVHPREGRVGCDRLAHVFMALVGDASADEGGAQDLVEAERCERRWHPLGKLGWRRRRLL